MRRKEIRAWPPSYHPAGPGPARKNRLRGYAGCHAFAKPVFRLRPSRLTIGIAPVRSSTPLPCGRKVASSVLDVDRSLPGLTCQAQHGAPGCSHDRLCHDLHNCHSGNRSFISSRPTLIQRRRCNRRESVNSDPRAMRESREICLIPECNY